MKKALLTLPVLALLGAPLTAQTVFNPEKGEPSPVNEPTLGCTAIPDDGYDGTIGSMGCVMVPGDALIVEDVTVDLGVNHTWVGDLVVKVQSPEGTVTTLMSRPGFAEPADDGDGCCGSGEDLVAGSPVTYLNGGATSAELMGDAGGNVCEGDGLCEYSPFPDQGPGTDLSDFNGENGEGDWMVCVGDSAAADVGEICSAAVNITGSPASMPFDIAVPTLDYVGLAALLGALALAGLIFIRRRG